MIRQFLDNGSQKMKSLKEIYALIRKYGPVAKTTLTEMTGMKPTTCARLIDELSQAGLIKECGLGESSGGRKPLMYQIDPSFAYLFGVDIARLYTRVVFMDLSLSILEEVRLPMNEKNTPDLTLAFVEEQIQRIMAKRNVSLSQVLGIGVGSVGPIDRNKGIILNPLHFSAKGWNYVPVVQRLKEAFNTLVLLDNGANTAVLGEYRNGLWKDVKSVVYNITGVGIRLGVLTNEQVIRGPVDMEGAYGHMIVDVHGKQCTCGNYGCVKTVGTILAIKEQVIHRLKRGQSSILIEQGLQPDQVEFADICKAVKAKDDLCMDVVKDCAFYYGIGLSNMIYLIHPELVILGGALFTELDLFYEVAVETAKKRASLYPGFPVKFSRGSLGDMAVAVGAGSMVFDYYII